MSLLVAIVLGAVQGLTEFIPVSSSGHLVLIGEIIDLGNTFEFDVLLNIGTLAALVWYTRDKLRTILKQILGGDYEFAFKIVVATIPAAAVGLLFDEQISGLNTESWLVVLMLFVIGLAMVLVRERAKPKNLLSQVSYRAALAIGAAQAIALIPGTSRSGITILAALLIGYTAKLAAEWSFIIAIPIIAGATLKTLLSAEGIEMVGDNFVAVIVGNIASFVVGMIAIDFLFRIVKKSDLRWFGAYRIGLAGLLAVLLLTGVV